MNKLNTLALSALLCVLAQSAFAQQSTASGAQKGLSSLFGKPSEDELLEPDLAFRLKVSAKGPNTIVAELIPAKGYYLYKERVRVVPAKDSGVTVAGLSFPKGEMKTDQIFGRTEVFKVAVPVEVALKRPPSIKNVSLTVSYQGCHEKLGVCYPPIDKTVNVALP
ncbi:MAG TPA: protein-disulfide reductase DsbD N-terminal domain-containing protein [Noviherbaspirillum sp.]